MVTKITAQRRICFSAGHRLLGHEGGCRNVHGHNYEVWVEAAPAAGDELDDVGRVIDFAELKARIGGWIHKNWDHSFLVSMDDTKMIRVLRALDSPYFALPFNPTAENMAIFLLEDVAPRVMEGTGIEIVAVQVVETENCTAVVQRCGGGS